MVRRSQDTPAWRLFGAALGAFAIVAQVLLSAGLIVEAAAGNQAGLNAADPNQVGWVICTHDPAATPDDTGAPPAPHPHGQCAACTCPQWAKLLATPPTPAVFLVLRPRSQMLVAYARLVAPQPRSPSSYASRAPPFSA